MACSLRQPVVARRGRRPEVLARYCILRATAMAGDGRWRAAVVVVVAAAAAAAAGRQEVVVVVVTVAQRCPSYEPPSLDVDMMGDKTCQVQ